MPAAATQSVFQILTHPDKCALCTVCELRCSMRLAKVFNPAASAITIHPRLDRIGADIVFTPQCDSCGICARPCPYGALELQRKEAR